ncbi:MAG TPA: biotin synthase BioB [Kofleriaceae bacterium]|nr:biotin synthase BioB [Kofleriaceae bacterium]
MSTTWSALADKALAGDVVTRDEARSVLHASADDTLALLDAAFRVRRAHWGRRVSLHVLENAKLGACPEDCGFCSQSSKHASPSGEAPIKGVDELVAGARRAHAARAKRYCMVTATRGPSQRDLDTICAAATAIKAEMDIELCASLGLLTEAKAARLAASGVDRFNHNLETSERHYDKIVSTHSWRDRVATVQIAKRAGMDTCCGGIVGLGESEDDLLDLAFALRELDVDSVPVNFLDARAGTPLAGYPLVEPGLALRALCMFRFVHPRTDLRVAGGREITLRALQVMALYPANSIFTQGYLTTAGATPHADHQMIRDAGFELELASGEAVPADPDAVAHLAPPTGPGRRPSLPTVA